MDRFARNYLIGIGAVAAVLVLLWFISSWDPGASRLNELLEKDPELVAYPYQFRVESLKNGVAVMKSPRSFQMPVIRFLAVMEPRLAGKPDNDPDVMAAQKRLAHHQKRAQAIVQEQPEVNSVRWTLDRNWYAERGIPVP